MFTGPNSVIKSVCEHLFRWASAKQTQGWTCKIDLAVLEAYENKVVDRSGQPPKDVRVSARGGMSVVQVRLS